ncbi:unnamed protein product [Nesidiocoris tenuis]|uniref:Uncharacterized protein n=1 Tax=Nesidiocoris tenuis TaxID=355587 RepID=A0A6H5HI20_9HEMI|nr:unnamed protein product [Nesidiocoris tenuis]
MDPHPTFGISPTTQRIPFFGTIHAAHMPNLPSKLALRISNLKFDTPNRTILSPDSQTAGSRGHIRTYVTHVTLASNTQLVLRLTASSIIPAPPVLGKSNRTRGTKMGHQGRVRCPSETVDVEWKPKPGGKEREILSKRTNGKEASRVGHAPHVLPQHLDPPRGLSFCSDLTAKSEEPT